MKNYIQEKLDIEAAKKNIVKKLQNDLFNLSDLKLLSKNELILVLDEVLDRVGSKMIPNIDQMGILEMQFKKMWFIIETLCPNFFDNLEFLNKLH